MPTRRDWLKNVVWTASAAGLALPAHLLAQPAGGKKVAFLVGVDKYLKPGFRALTCCERDVVQLEGALRELEFSQIEVLLGSGTGTKRATKANIEQALQKLVQQLGQDDLIVVMLSGHGQQFSQGGKTQEDAFFCPVDAVNRDATTLVSLSYVTDEVLANNVGKRLVLVDACRDAPKDPNKGAKGIQGRQITLAEDTGVFFSCRAGQQSYTNDELNHSLFTYCVLEALRGEGAVQGEVTWDGMVSHVKSRMAMADMKQRVPEGSLQSPISAGSVDHTVLGRVKSTVKTVGTKAGEERDDNGLKMKFVWCPPGQFTMGSPNSEKDRSSDEDQVQVTLTKGFWIGKYEVTQGEWERVMDTTPWKGKSSVKEGARYAATYVSWEDATEFATKLTTQERQAGRLPAGWRYTLPTEAQWEYACRAGTQTAYGFGSDESRFSEYAWWGGFTGDGNAKTEQYAHEVGLKKANAWGLHDVHGNVYEWCRDWYQETLPGGVDPEHATQASFRVVRGGSWCYEEPTCRTADRGFDKPGIRDYSLGFRVVRRSEQ
jgi:sulfatase modifying factor 1